jgi:hypothetical protein
MHPYRFFPGRDSSIRIARRKKVRLSNLIAGLRFVLFSLIALSLLLPIGAPVRAAIDLGSFTATPQDGSVLIEWETVTEFDIASFQVLRSDQENGDFSEISDFIPSKGAGLTGAQYSYPDTEVTNGVTYYYRLRAFDQNNISEDYDQTISATPGTPTPTLTPTQTEESQDPTSTSTPKPTDIPTATRTPTPTDDSYPPPATTAPPTPYPGIATKAPTSTPAASYPGPATRTPTRVPTSAPNVLPTPTLIVSQTPLSTNEVASFPLTITQVTSPTATLIPFPTITLEFPATALAAAPQSNSVQAETVSNQQDRGFNRYLPLGFILLIWVLLGVWFYFSSRSLE